MWPHKKGLGVRLSYGVEGNGVMAVETGDGGVTTTISLPRLRDQGYELKEIDGSTRTLVRNQTTSFTLNSQLVDDLESRARSGQGGPMNMNIPSPILKSCLSESSILASNIAYDPTGGNVMPVFHVRLLKGNATAKAMAYVSGESGTILNISMLNYEHVPLQRRGDSSHKTSLYVPDLSNPTQVLTSDPIKQIETPRVAFDYIPPFLLVRTSFRIYLVECLMKKKHLLPTVRQNIDISMLGEIAPGELCGEEFADVRFNPHDFNQFAAVDIKGNFGIWKINKDSKRPVSKVKLDTSQCEPGTHDVAELSNWKKICWGNSINNILVVSRSSIMGFDLFPQLTSKKLITSNTWSRILDIHRFEDQAFLLTTKELIWFDVGDTLERRISWKTFLNDEDPSLRLSVTRTGDEFVCLIYSQVSPLIFVYNLGIKDDKPYSLRDPYYIRRKTTGRLKQVELIELNRDLYQSVHDTQEDFVEETDGIELDCKKFGVLELGIDLGLSIAGYSDKENLELVEYSELRRNSTTGLVERDSQFFRKFSRNMANRVVERLKTYANGDIDETEAIQKFAFALGEGASKLNSNSGKHCDQRYYSLLDLVSTIPPIIKDLNEFDSMLEQLEEFYNSKQIISTKIINKEINEKTKLVKQEDSIDTIDGIYSNLSKTFENDGLKQYNETKSIKWSSVLLGTSLIKNKSDNLTEHYKNEFESTLNQSSNQVKKLFAQWEDSDENTRQHEQDMAATSILSSMPVINSASKTKTKKHRSTKRAASQLSQIPSSQSMPSSSQLASPKILSQSTQLPYIQSQSSNEPRSSQSPFKSQKRFSSQLSQGHKKKKKKKSGFA